MFEILVQNSKILILAIFGDVLQDNPKRNNKLWVWYLLYVSLALFLRMRNISEKEKLKTSFFFFKNAAELQFDKVIQTSFDFFSEAIAI